MAITDARRSADAKGVRTVEAVFIKFPRQGGKFIYQRQPWNFVKYDWGNGEVKTYMELCIGNRFKSVGNRGFETAAAGDDAVSYGMEAYDGIKILEPSDLNMLPGIGRNDA